MIRFIDVNTGNVYNGNTPYVHWFDGKQSIGLNYDKRFIILSDKQDIDIQLDSEVFYLVDPNKLLDENNKVYKYDKEYYNLKTLKTSVLHSTGISYSEYFIHSFNIITQGNYVGEITDDLYIDSERFILGADFYDENESLGINLTNFGAEISNEVQRAIYEKNIDEQKVDFILMNRKFKELLNEYINIIANKGSYKSLLNSLKWFEYGELTSIYEFWKREEPNKNYLTKRDLSSIANSRIEELLSSNTKSTFIGISCALNKIKTIDGEIVYENKYEELPNTLQLLNEPNPELKENALLWSKEDMSLKMTLLGNFFATYFMPIHLDLLFSTIEKIVYTDTIKLVSFPKIDRFDFVDYLDIFKCNIDKTYNLNNIETFTYPDTIFGFENEKSENINYRDEHLEVLGVETSLPNLEGLSENEIFEYGKAYNLQHYKGIGVIIPFRCELVLSNNDVLTKASIKVFRKYINEEERVFEESILERERYDIKYKKEDGKAFVDFNILMKNIGDYKVQLSFRRSDGFEYIKVFNYTVNDDSYQELKMYKLVPKDKTFLDNFEIDEWFPETENYKTVEIGNIGDYVLNPVQQSILDDVIYTQFISTTTKNIATTHTNQVFIIKTNNDTDLSKIIFKKKGVVNEFDLFSIFVGLCGEKMSNGFKFYKEQIQDSFIEVFPDVHYIDYIINDSMLIIYNEIGEVIGETLIPQTDLKDVIKPEVIQNATVTGRSVLSYQESIGATIQNIKFMPNVYWFTMNRFGEIETNEIPEIDTKSEYIVKFGGTETKYLIGINTDFNTENSITYSIKKSQITGKDKTRIWVKDMFIPYFFKLEEFGTTSNFDYISLGLKEEDIFKRRNSEDTYKIKNYDVVCFLPSSKCLRRPKDFMWKYKNTTINDEIIPLTFRRFDMEIENGKIVPNDNKNTDKYPFPTILQPLFGRYDFRKLVYPGYYDITLNYKLDDASNTISKTISSQFIVEKNHNEPLYDIIRKIVYSKNISYSNELLVEILTKILTKINIGGFSDSYLDQMSLDNNIQKTTLISLLEEVLNKINDK